MKCVKNKKKTRYAKICTGNLCRVCILHICKICTGPGSPGHDSVGTLLMMAPRPSEVPGPVIVLRRLPVDPGPARGGWKPVLATITNENRKQHLDRATVAYHDGDLPTQAHRPGA